jgi:cell division protein FtsQ
MPARVRGGSLAQAKPRPKASSSSRSAAPRSTARAPYPAGKLHAAYGQLPPRWAVGITSAVLVLGAGIVLMTGDRLHQAGFALGQGVAGQLAHAGFRLNALHVEGASAMARRDIVRAAGLYRDQPILGLDLDQVRARIERVGWVKTVRVVRLLPDTLVIAVTERPTVAVWQNQGRLHVVDDHGVVIPEADPARFADLPLVVGEGANANAAAILEELRRYPRVTARMEALVRVDDRRWDIRMKDGGLIALPAVDEGSALVQLDQLDQTRRILDLGFSRIDLRDPELVAVRRRDVAAPGQQVTAGA